ncbi:hypothetical protein ERIC2_c27150 [Paenibacillus larvae subsp. larvae DSM 25430]|uniref:Uncharacterized protein n=1 Tax=Paenibacillus larvae subsp. larvae DSM 25430 TaxID=697284 RepID=V9WBK6_9BACL|nr:hypothetical protein ERIC2_c27150 [Paenibacillus larvae subsp. larvae DSM 25430]
MGKRRRKTKLSFMKGAGIEWMKKALIREIRCGCSAGEALGTRKRERILSHVKMIIYTKWAGSGFAVGSSI